MRSPGSICPPYLGGDVKYYTKYDGEIAGLTDMDTQSLRPACDPSVVFYFNYSSQ